MRTPTDLMDIVKVQVMDRPSGQPASADSVERERLLANKAEGIAKLKAMRVANEPPAEMTPKRKPRPKTQSDIGDRLGPARRKPT